MKSVLIMLASVVVALTASRAAAQPFLEFHVRGISAPMGEVGPVDYRVVVDASLPPSGFDGTKYFFSAVHVETLDTSNNNSFSPVSLGDPVSIEIPFGFVIYTPSLGKLSISTDGAVVGIYSLLGDFSDISSSLPDDPAAYLIDVTDPNARIDLRALGETSRWTPDDGFQMISDFGTGAFAVRVRAVDDPNPPECLADINNDDSVDFFDISVFLQLYSDGCP